MQTGLENPLDPLAVHKVHPPRVTFVPPRDTSFVTDIFVIYPPHKSQFAALNAWVCLQYLAFDGGPACVATAYEGTCEF